MARFDRTTKQSKTKSITISSIVGASAFQAGIEDYKAGVQRFDEFAGKFIRKGTGWRSCGWDYERGRLYAASIVGIGQVMPPLRDGRAVNPTAINSLSEAF